MRFNITKLFDDAKAKASDAGKQLVDFIQYLSEFCELVGRSLRNGLTFGDNFDCDVITASLLHDTPTSINTKKTVTGLLVLRASSTTKIITGSNWYYDERGDFKVWVTFSLPAPTSAIDVKLVLLYG